MTVKELIALLQSQQPDLPVAYSIYSEYCLLKADDITIQSLCAPREDGWVHSKRPDKPSQNYLVFPGN